MRNKVLLALGYVAIIVGVYTLVFLGGFNNIERVGALSTATYTENWNAAQYRAIYSSRAGYISIGPAQWVAQGTSSGVSWTEQWTAGNWADTFDCGILPNASANSSSCTIFQNNGWSNFSYVTRSVYDAPGAGNAHYSSGLYGWIMPVAQNSSSTGNTVKSYFAGSSWPRSWSISGTITK